MALPSADVLSRWTVGQVNSWLSECSLTAFRDDFLKDRIDGSKLMRMQPHEIDSKYKSISARKRQILKECLSKIESPKSASWISSAPQIPPRPGPRPAAPLPTQQDDDSEDGWGSDFVDDIGSDSGSGEEYLEPTVTPAHLKQKAAPPVQQETPPPRPPRVNRSGPDIPSYSNTPAEPPSVTRHRLPPPQPQPPPPAEQMLPPDDVYEIVEDDTSPQKPESDDAEYLCPDTTDLKPNNYLDLSETCKKAVEASSASHRASRDVPLPPRPTKQGSTEKTPQTPAKQSSTERPPPPQPSRQQGGWLFNNEQATGDDLSAFDWYHGKISRDIAQNIFHREQTDGMFLIRKSERDPQQPYTLVIWHCSRIWNIPIRKVANNKFAAGKFKAGENHFDSLPALIEHFKVVSLNLKSNDEVQGTHNLTVPAPKQ